jgi:hypothetical protein
LIVNLATVGVVRIDQAEVELRPGEGILILPYQFHAFPQTQRKGILWLFVTFECERTAPLKQFRCKTFRFGAAIRRRLLLLLEQYRAGEAESANQTLAFELACLLAQLQTLVRESLTSPVVADWRSYQLLDDIEDYLRQPRTAAISIQDVAKHLHISQSHLRARFRATFDCSLGTYVYPLRS